MIRRSGNSSETLTADDFLHRIAQETSCEGLLSCHLCRLWRNGNLADIGKLRELLRIQEKPKTELLSILCGSANDWDVVVLTIPHAIDCCIESRDEQTLLEVLLIPEAMITSSQIQAIAFKDMRRALKAVIGHSIGSHGSSPNIRGTAMSKVFLYPDRADCWTLTDILQVLLQNGISDSTISAVLQGADDYDEGAVTMLLRHKKEQLALSCVNNKLQLNQGEILSSALDHRCLVFTLQYAQMVHGDISGDVEGFFARVINEMQRQYYIWPYSIYLLKVCVESMPSGCAKQFIDYLVRTLGSNDPAQTFVMSSLNPIKICLCLHELVSLLGEHITSIKLRCDVVCQDLSQLAVSIANELESEDAAVEMYQDEDFEGRDIIHISCELGLTDMFLVKHVERLAYDAWNGSSEEFAYFFQPSSSLFQLLSPKLFYLCSSISYSLTAMSTSFCVVPSQRSD